VSELYKKHRPTKFVGVVGQPEAVAVLENMVDDEKLPHSILFSGPSGTGKTTLARILKEELDCSSTDFQELNCADFRGIDMVREIRSRMSLAPVSGSCRIWLIDEAHQMTSQSQNAFLKILEDTPDHVFFFLCTTNPTKLIPTVRNRCTHIQLKNIPSKDLLKLLQVTVKREKEDVDTEVLEKIVEVSDGSARRCLVYLDQVLNLDDKDEMLNCLKDVTQEGVAIEIARGLMRGDRWEKIAGTLKTVEEEPESLRRMVLGYCTSVMLGGSSKEQKATAFNIMQAFRDHFYDSGKAGLVAACYEVLIAMKC